MPFPESMSRVVIVGAKSQMDEAIDALFELEAAHLIDHTVGADEGFTIGAPLPFSAKASERLLKVRAAGKELGVDFRKHQPQPMSQADVKSKIEASEVEAVNKEVFSIIDERNALQHKVAETQAQLDVLQRLYGLPLSMDLYSGYQSLSVFVGTTKDDPTKALSGIEDIEFFVDAPKKSRATVAVFAAAGSRDAVSNALSELGFAEMAVPDISGNPGDAIPTLEGSIAEMNGQIEALDARIKELYTLHADAIVAYDEELSIAVEKGETPLRIAVSDYSFVIDAWVPTAKVDFVGQAINERFNGSVHMELQETRGRSVKESEEAEKRFEKPPSKLKNGAYGKRFEYPTSLVSTPRYQEIDPSTVIGIFFPFFFGLMVGDVGYAIPFIILGAFGLKTAKSKDFQAIATVLFFGGIWAFIFGFFMFSEMLGMHFAGPVDATSVTWESLLGINLPDWFTGIFPAMENHGETYIGVSKLHSVVFLLKMSVYIGIVHLAVSYLVGFINVRKQHGFGHAMHEKGGWLFSLFGVAVLCYGLSEVLFVQPMEFTQPKMMTILIGAVLIAIGVGLCWKTEKAQAILELPGIVGNILSYTRLAAIGMSKAGMALAFNYIAIKMIAGGMDGIVGIVLGFLVFLIGHLMIWTLAILSAGLHALRLQYVEMMNKFFVGGGVDYDPLAVKRIHTEVAETEV